MEIDFHPGLWKSRKQMSESMLVWILLTFSGGYMDAYTYLFRGGVFANAQTGNLILLGLNLVDGNFLKSIKYIIPVFSFLLGVFIAQLVRMRMQTKRWFHWRQLTILIEALLMLGVSFLTGFHPIANSMVSFACGLQVQSFRVYNGKPIATTMCVGNLRTGADYLCAYIHSKKKRHLHTSLLYFGIIGIFMLGAVGGKIGVHLFGQKATLINVLLLGAAFILMMAEPTDANSPSA